MAASSAAGASRESDGSATDFTDPAHGGLVGLRRMIENADPAGLDTIAARWTAVHDALLQAQQDLLTHTLDATSHWKGAAAECFAAEADSLYRGLGDGAAYAFNASSGVSFAAQSLRTAKADMPKLPGTLESWSRALTSESGDAQFNNDLASGMSREAALAADGGQLSLMEERHQQAIVVMQKLEAQYASAAVMIGATQEPDRVGGGHVLTTPTGSTGSTGSTGRAGSNIGTAAAAANSSPQAGSSGSRTGAPGRVTTFGGSGSGRSALPVAPGGGSPAAPDLGPGATGTTLDGGHAAPDPPSSGGAAGSSRGPDGTGGPAGPGTGGGRAGTGTGVVDPRTRSGPGFSKRSRAAGERSGTGGRTPDGRHGDGPFRGGAERSGGSTGRSSSGVDHGQPVTAEPVPGSETAQQIPSQRVTPTNENHPGAESESGVPYGMGGFGHGTRGRGASFARRRRFPGGRRGEGTPLGEEFVGSDGIAERIDPREGLLEREFTSGGSGLPQQQRYDEESVYLPAPETDLDLGRRRRRGRQGYLIDDDEIWGSAEPVNPPVID